MNWWKTSKIHNFEDRNRVNRSIHWLEEVADNLSYLSELVFMTSRKAKNMALQLIAAKQMTNYPIISEMLEEAIQVALDNPKKFAYLCLQAVDRINSIKADLIEQRSDFVDELNTNKGWAD